MPFSCTFLLNNGAISPKDDVVFECFIEEAFGRFHNGNVRIAKIIFNGGPAFISSTCPCFPSTKAQLAKGDPILKDTIIGYFSTNGEDIPYDRPYASIDI